jgi:epoxyqueuosine reductase
MEFVSKLLRENGFDHFGFARLQKPLTMDIYREWLDHGHHGNMDYLRTHADLKERPKELAPRALSAIVIAKSYFPHPYSGDLSASFRTALYAKGGDYHHQFRRELEDIARRLKDEFQSEEFLCFTDSAPILERDLAYRAGIGWVGKNTCVIHPQKGSLFFLGQILTSLDCEPPSSPIRDFCGTCSRCIEACPTQAIESPRKLNATKCISYWTLEARADAPEELRAKIGDWFAGCDICQTVCPWNEKAFGRANMRTLSADRVEPPKIEDLRWILTRSNHELLRHFASSPLQRPRPRGLKRNALQIIGNLRLTDLRPEVESFLEDEHLKNIARWALTQLT